MSDIKSDEDQGPIEVGVRRMLKELAIPAGELRAEHGELEGHFVTAVQPLLELLCGTSATTRGDVDFAVRQLIARAISDTIASFHLITHGYLNQAYSTMRTAYEAIDIARLITRDSEQAQAWVSTERGHLDFSPSAVRRRLGENRFDPVYSRLSELSHPRLEASKLTSFGIRSHENEDLTIVIRVGPFMLDETADHWLAAMFLGPLIGKISLALSQLAETGAVTEAAWDQAVLNSHAAIVDMGKLIGGKLKECGVEADGLLQQFERAPEIIAQANAAFPDEPPRFGG